MQFNCIEPLESRTLLAAGVIDSSYHPALDHKSTPFSILEIVCVQADGKSIHYAPLNKKKQTLWRQNLDGSLDKSFGSAGKVNLPDTPKDVAIAPDGKIVVAYAHNPKKRLHVSRFLPNGRPDRSFAGDGDGNMAIRGRFNSIALIVQDDGKIVVGGNTSGLHYGPSVFRVNANGKLDKNFGNKGQSTVPNASGYLNDLDIRRGDDRIVAVGSNHDQWGVWIFAPDGAMEWSSGLPTIDPTTVAGDALSVVVAGDGSLLVGGEYTAIYPTDDPNHYSPCWIVGRYPAPNSGKSFSYGRIDGSDWLQMALQTDGKLVMTSSGEVTRLNPDLTLDKSFGSSGQAALDFSPFSLAIQPDGKILVDGGGGTNIHKIREVRLSGDSPG